MGILKRVLLKMLDQSGATDGQAPIWSDADDAWVASDVTATVAAADVTFTPTGGVASTNVQAAIAEVDTEKAPLASPTFTGDPKAPTPVTADNDTSVATTAFVHSAIAAGGGGVAASAVTFAPTGGVASTDVQAAIAEVDTEKAPLASPTFTGDPKAPTPTAGDNDTSIATTAFVQAAVTALIGGAPGALDTLKELADAINDDASFAATITAALALKAPLASPALTGAPTAPTVAGTSDSTTKIATTAFVQAVAALLAPLASPALTGNPTVPTQTAGTNNTRAASTAYADNAVAKQPEILMVAVSGETTSIAVGTAKVTFRMPFAFTVTAVRASLSTASSSGNPAIDVKDGGSSIFSTTLTIDSTEKTSQTAATAAVISGGSHAFADDAEVTIDIGTAGTGAKGLKLTFIGTRT